MTVKDAAWIHLRDEEPRSITWAALRTGPGSHGWQALSIAINVEHKTLAEYSGQLESVEFEQLCSGLETANESEFEPLEPGFLVRTKPLTADTVEVLLMIDVASEQLGYATYTGPAVLLHVDRPQLVNVVAQLRAQSTR